MGATFSANNLKPFFRCQNCQMRHKRQKREQKEYENPLDHDQEEEEEVEDQQIRNAFYALADDPAYISRRQFEECLGRALGPALWQHLLWDDEKTMNFEQFVKNGKMLKQMRLNNYAQMGMHPNKLLRACLECCEIGPADESAEDFVFLHKLAEQMGNSPEEVIAWKDRNCPRLFQSIHEHVLNKFLGIPKSKIEESKWEESKLLSRTQMFFLKHNLPRAIFFEKAEENVPPNDESRVAMAEGKKGEEEKEGASWTKLYDSHSEGIGPEIFQQNVFPFDGPTVAIFQMDSGEVLVLSLDEQWKNGRQPFGGPYTVLFKFQPEFERIEKQPPAVHCNFKDDSLRCPFFFNGGSILAINNDFSNVKGIEVWGCARFREQRMEMPKMGEEEAKIFEKRKPRVAEEQGGKKAVRRTAAEKWTENPDKQLMEMAGFTFADNRRRGEGGKPNR